MKITPSQFRAARALLGLRRADVAERAGVNMRMLERIETAKNKTPGQYETTVAVQQALEAAGVQFTDGNGVRLREVR